MCITVEPNSQPKHSKICNKSILSILLESLFNERIYFWNPSFFILICEDIRQTQPNSLAREYIRLSFPELQFEVLEFVSRLVYDIHSMDQCKAYQMWDVFFSEYFFRAGLEYAAIVASQTKGGILRDDLILLVRNFLDIFREVKTLDDERSEKRRTYLFTRLLVSVLEVVQFCGSLPNRDNTDECHLLLVCQPLHVICLVLIFSRI